MLKIPGISGGADRTIAAPAAAAAAIAAATDAAGPPPPPLPPDDPFVIKLSKPLTTHKGVQHELRMREPIAADFIDIGRIPFDVRGEGEDRRAVVDFKLIAQWLSRLTDVDVILLGMLAHQDWLQATGKLNAIIMRTQAKPGN